MDLKNQRTISEYKKYPTSNTFRENINELEEKLPVILDDFKKYYVLFNKDPEVSEYQRLFQNMESNMQEINNKLITITTNISETINGINDDLLELNEKIETEKEKNINLNNFLGNIQNQKNGANEMINNYTEIYNVLYLRNIAMVVGIFGCIFIGKKLVHS